jgi:hypothetical protein
MWYSAVKAAFGLGLNSIAASNNALAIMWPHHICFVVHAYFIANRALTSIMFAVMMWISNGTWFASAWITEDTQVLPGITAQSQTPLYCNLTLSPGPVQSFNNFITLLGCPLSIFFTRSFVGWMIGR